MSSPRPPLPVALPALLALFAVGCSEATDPESQFVASLRPIPDTTHLEIGESIEFDLRAYDRWGNVLEGRVQRAEWSLSSPGVVRLDTLETGVSTTAVAPGEALLIVRLGRGQATARVFVPPPGLTDVQIEPSPVRVSRGGHTRPRVRLYDASGSEMDPRGFRISWTTVDPSIAGVPLSSDPHYTTRVSGREEGQTRIRAIVNEQVAREDVVVILEPLQPGVPTIEPQSPTSLELRWPSTSVAYHGYRVSRAPSSGGPYSEVSPAGLAAYAWLDTIHVDTDLAPGTTYFYRVEACNEHGCSEPSEPGSGTTLEEGQEAGEAAGEAPRIGKQEVARLVAVLDEHGPTKAVVEASRALEGWLPGAEGQPRASAPGGGRGIRSGGRLYRSDGRGGSQVASPAPVADGVTLREYAVPRRATSHPLP